ncbi:MAG: hypothetical protein IT324_24610 [Anaerolineae bacterium]|nr:hypothetical protein [Anaerolineae bacterium]
MDERTLHWLAGLLEGEGSFLKPPPSSPNNPRITLQMTDEDVIQRVCGIFELTYYQRSRKNIGNRKPLYKVTFRGSRAAELMGQLYPLMGQRRQSPIKEALALYAPQVILPIRPAPKPLELFPLIDIPNPPMGMTETEFYWLAGLLEGEGSFVRGQPSNPNGSKIQLFMTDEDVVLRAAKCFGHSHCSTFGRENNYKTAYYTSIGRLKAVELMKQLRPLMSQRRQSQIDAAIAAYKGDKTRGTNHPNAKLNEDKVRAIKQDLANGVSLTVLAGVDKGLIWQIKAGRIWQHVK